ncbi:MAG: carbohydrate ABC transporter permease [Clostridia bacterium]|nr:carbohydrate ABC transporter permease [Clostridia bacterium]
MKTAARIKNSKLFLRAALFILAILLLAPLALTFFYSFFSQAEIKAYLATRGSLSDDKWMEVLLSPRTFSIGQYWSILIQDTAILRRFWLSIFYTSAVLLGEAAVVPAMAYALSAFRFRGRNVIFFSLLMLMLLPFQVTMVPNVLILREMNLLNTVWAVILPMWFNPFYVFLCRQYMVSVPRELYDAAQLDGAGTIRCYFHIVLPVCRPVIGAAAALSFADVWNMVEQPLTFLSKREDLHPLSVVFNQLITNPTGVEFAGAALYILPALFVFLFFLDDIVSGIQLTELK